MRRNVMGSLIAVIVVVSAACSAEAVQDGHSQDLGETREAWGRAIAEGDVERILSFWTEDVVIYPVSEPAVQGIDAGAGLNDDDAPPPEPFESGGSS